MNIQQFGVSLAGTILLGAGALAVTTAPAVAAPAPNAAVAHASPGWDFRKGYREGRTDGWDAAREDCKEPYKVRALFDDHETDYMRGYERGFTRGFEEGYDEYCD